MEQLIPDFTSSPSLLCSIKGTSIHTWARQFFGTLVHHLGLLTFQVKLLLLAPTTHWFTGLLYSEQTEPIWTQKQIMSMYLMTVDVDLAYLVEAFSL